MDTNRLPDYDMSHNTTGCCPRFDPEGWDDQALHFEDKLFVRAKTRSVAHFPLNMGSVFKKTFEAIEDADALDEKDLIILSRDKSAWSAEHLFAVAKSVPDQEMTHLSGDFVTKVFEGPYRNVPKWCDELADEVKQHGHEIEETYFFYTTCPKCAKTYGKNYVVAVGKLH